MTGDSALRRPSGATTLLDLSEVVDYLVDQGVVMAAEAATVAPLGGGVSNAVFAVHTARHSLVVKQALPALRVADLWEADPSRALREATAMHALHRLTPASVPECVHIDEDRFVIVMPHAPAGWTDWKSRLMAGEAEVATAHRLGRLLATWHLATREDVPNVLRDRTCFHQLRVDPYYRTVMARRPDLAELVSEHLERMLDAQDCLVHGDFSPKNVLLGLDGLWIIDLEVAHVGDPAFDLAFMISHLVLKSIHRPGDADAYRACGIAFSAGYRNVASATAPPWRHVLGHVGALLLARVIGKSPVEYLGPSQKTQAVTLGQRLLTNPPDAVDEVWTRLGEVLAP
jgi:aminoglycoside phosphotransferase (APT) family kinase protein